MLDLTSPHEPGNEFAHVTEVRHIPHGGMSNVEALAFLRSRFPEVCEWVQWLPGLVTYGDHLQELVQKPGQAEGQFGAWKWRRVPSEYADLVIWKPGRGRIRSKSGWIGLVSISGPAGEEFLLFSYLSTSGEVGRRFFVSTTETDLLHRFASALKQDRMPSESRKITIHTTGSAETGMEIDPDVDELMIMDEETESDISEQAAVFFRNRELYDRLMIPYRRGFLFVGPPGNGKTMMVRRLIRMCWKAHRVSVWVVQPSRRQDDDSLGRFLQNAASDAPGILVMEEVDCLARETAITRGGLLSHLDGLSTAEGLLIIGTTNDPGGLDPALAHRPSRFDRVWRFDNPSRELRRHYVRTRIGSMPRETLEKIVDSTEDWSFAYMNELRTTAAILALRSRRCDPDSSDLLEAHRLLAAQFQAGRRNHEKARSDRSVGFGKSA